MCIRDRSGFFGPPCIYQNVQYLIGGKKCVLNFTAVRYSLHKCRERHYAKNDNSPFKYQLFPRVFEFMEARKTCDRVVRTSVWLMSYSEELSNKICIVKTSETARGVTLLGPVGEMQ